MLYLVPTPIGNIDDMTYRAVDILREVDLILAEDTRTSGHLLKHYEIETKMSAYHAFNEHKMVDQYVDQLKQGKSIALVSDAGTPGISDPGFLLVRSAIQEEIKVAVLPGPTAIIPALVMSGLPCDRFYFEGFLPHKKGRKTRWEALAQMSTTVVLYESPHRIIKCIEEVKLYCGPDRRMAIARELSKVYEEVLRGTPDEILTQIGEKKLKGEMVVIIAGNQ